MNLFQPFPLQRKDGTAVNGLLGTTTPSPAQPPATGAAPITAAPQQLNVFGGSTQQSWGGSLFSQDPAWSASGSSAAQPTAPSISPAAASATPAVSAPASRPANPAPIGNSWKDYYSSNPDVAEAYADPQIRNGMTADQFAKAHYQKFGQAESRALPPAAKLEMLTIDRELTPQQLAEQLSTPEFAALAAKLPELEQKWLSGRIKLNDKNAGTNVLAAENLYQQIGGVREAVKQNNGGKEFWSGEGHGSLEKNQMAFTRALMEKGITDLRQLDVREEPVMATGTFERRGDQWVRIDEKRSGYGKLSEQTVTRTEVPVSDPALIEKLNAQYKPEKPLNQIMSMSQREFYRGPKQYQAEYDTGKKSQSLVNKETGEEIHTTPRGDNTFRIAYTTRGEGMVHWNVKMVPTTDPASGAKSYIPIPVQQYEDTSDMGIISPILAVASFIPGVAPFAMGINAALAASTGNWTGAILSAAGAYGSYLGNANAALNAAGPPTAANAATIANNASTISNIKTATGLVGAINAANKGDALGAIGAGAGAALNSGLAGDSANALRSISKGVGAIRAVQGLQKNLQSGNPLKLLGSTSSLFAMARAY